jgi:hypothetical protein
MNQHQKSTYARFLKRQKPIDLAKKPNVIILNPKSISENIIPKGFLTPSKKPYLTDKKIEILKKWSKRRKLLRYYTLELVEHKHFVFNNPIADTQIRGEEDDDDISDYMLFDDTEKQTKSNIRKRMRQGYETNKRKGKIPISSMEKKPPTNPEAQSIKRALKIKDLQDRKYSWSGLE